LLLENLDSGWSARLALDPETIEIPKHHVQLRCRQAVVYNAMHTVVPMSLQKLKFGYKSYNFERTIKILLFERQQIGLFPSHKKQKRKRKSLIK
jgi:hypothetical protein